MNHPDSRTMETQTPSPVMWGEDSALDPESLQRLAAIEISHQDLAEFLVLQSSHQAYLDPAKARKRDIILERMARKLNNG